MVIKRGAVLLHSLAAAAFVLCTVGGLRFPANDRLARKGANAGCQIREYLEQRVEVPGCKSQVVPVRGCFGQCQTYEVPILLPPHKVSSHKMCSYGAVEWQTVELEDCEPGVNRTYSYRNAVRCRCKRCSPMDTYCAGM